MGVGSRKAPPPAFIRKLTPPLGGSLLWTMRSTRPSRFRSPAATHHETAPTPRSTGAFQPVPFRFVSSVTDEDPKDPMARSANPSPFQPIDEAGRETAQKMIAESSTYPPLRMKRCWIAMRRSGGRWRGVFWCIRARRAC